MLAEEIGLHIGDGSMNFYKGKGLYQLRGHITDDRVHYDTRISFLYESLFGIKISLRKMPSTGVYGFQIWNNDLAKYKHSILGLPLGKKYHINIPKKIMADKTLAKSFLCGYFDTDGGLYLEKKYGKLYPRLEMNTISKNLAEQISILLTKLNFRHVKYTEKRKKYGWQDLYRVRINGIEMTKRWFSEIQPKNQKHINKFRKISGPGQI